MPDQPEPNAAEPQPRLGDWQDRTPPVRRPFPGPPDAEEFLRVAMDREAYAALVAHAKESLDMEVCGVLVGEVGEDEDGRFVEVKATLPGQAAREGGTHVTFTHDTWDSIHRTLDDEYPKLQIVGWYHSHPGHGVQFSEPDRFIIERFFPAPTQPALVIDPLGGDVALAVNTETGVRYLERFWVGGREHRCRVPAGAADSGPEGETSLVREELRRLSSRLNQTRQAVDDLRAGINRAAWIGLAVALVALALAAAYGTYRRLLAPPPPQPAGLVPVPVIVGDKVVVLGVGVLAADLPPDVEQAYLRKLREYSQAAAAMQARSAPPPAGAAGPPAAEAAKAGAAAPPEGRPSGGRRQAPR